MRRPLATVAALGLLLTAACGDDDAGSTTTTTTATAITPTTTAATPTTEAAAGGPIVFSGQGNDLVAYATEPPFERQVVVTNAADDPEGGRDVNGQICFDPDDRRRFVAGEDTDQGGEGDPGWGIFTLDGDAVGELEATQVAKLVPTYQGSDDNAENYGCGFLPDGRLVTTDVGNQAAGEPDGQLIVWFPPFGMEGNRYCKVDVALATGQGILVTDEHVHVAQARAGVFRYRIADLPTSDDAAGGCGGTDDTGAPFAAVAGEPFVTGDDVNQLPTPSGIAEGPDGRLYVASVFNGVISELRPDGTFVRTILRPRDGEVLGAAPYSTGTPLGLAVGDDGTIYYADIGVVIEPSVGPGERTGSVRRITFVDGEPQPPETMDAGLSFPDGVGIFVS